MKRVVENADESTYGLLFEVMGEFHPALVEAGVQVTLLMVGAVTSTGRPVSDTTLMCNGSPAVATVRIATPGDIRMGYGDVVIRIDAHDWREELSRANRAALLDHELCHVGIRRDRAWRVLRKPDGKPKLKLVPHDIELGVFYSVVRRHGQDAPDFYGTQTLCNLVRDEMKVRRLVQEMSNGHSRKAI